MKIPQDNRWTQTNDGNILGILHETQNVTFDKNGILRLSRKAFNRYNSSDDANLGYIMAIKYYNGQYAVVTDDNAFLTDFGGTSTSEITLTADTGLNSDAEVMFSRLYISTNDNLDYYDGSLNAGNYATTAGVPHPLAVFESLNYLAIGNGNTVVLLNSSHAAQTTLTIPAQYQVTTLAYRNEYLYVGTKNLNGGEAKVFVWDGSTGGANSEIPVGASWVYSVIPYQTVCACVTNQGQLLLLNGNTPIQIGQFPVYADPDAIWDDGTNVTYIGKIMHRGMVTIGDTIWLNVNGTVDQGEVPEMKHGLWVYDPQVGLYHRASHSLDRSVVETPSNLTSSTLTLSTHNLKTGDMLIFRNAGSLTGVQTATKYYVYVASATTVKLAISRRALQAGNYVTIGGSIGAASVSYAPNTDWFGGYSQYQGAISPVNPEEPIFVGWESQVIWGARISTFAGDAFYCIMSLTDAWNIGRFTTQRIYGNQIQNVWKKLHIFLDGLHLDNEKIIVKYKTSDHNTNGFPTKVYLGTWASATTITSVSSSQDEDEWSDLSVGDELTFVDGTGRGYTAHITAIVNNSGTYTVTIDESIGTSTNSVYFYADKFKKLKATGNEIVTKDTFSEELNGANSTWTQFKVELRGYETEISHLFLETAGEK